MENCGVSFQFPSNGKALSDTLIAVVAIIGVLCVSIPFKRESPFGRKKEDPKKDPAPTSFNSLQTGKPFRTRKPGVYAYPGLSSFQFPSNGKALMDVELKYPFQFPSNGKALSDRFLTPYLSLVDLQGFQFPSNGKALSDTMFV